VVDQLRLPYLVRNDYGLMLMASSVFMLCFGLLGYKQFLRNQNQAYKSQR
jgi:hypothetical protein